MHRNRRRPLAALHLVRCRRGGRKRIEHGRAGAGFGVGRRRQGAATPAALVAAADKALYRAKRGGRNRVVAATEAAQDRLGTGQDGAGQEGAGQEGAEVRRAARRAT